MRCIRDSLPTHPWHQWQSLAALGQHLQSQQPTALRITGIPHAGIWTEVATAHTLQHADGHMPLSQLRAGLSAPDAVLPHQCHHLGQQLGYTTTITYSPTPGLIDLIYTRNTPAALTDVYLPADTVGPIADYVNDLTSTQLNTQLRQFAATRLPQYMVPAVIMILDSLPLTVNGKLDRRALPTPEFLTTTTYQAPRNPHEHTLAALFSETLGITPIGINDNFFDHGGHSLSATRLVARIRTQLAIEVPIRVIFESPT
ncbi:phosphopantetheine-binding protein, partial [Mycobacterium simulans]|uniref:phosphopantetheine-binding protein n=1 Tax=Mycobacterium simulans TaxID=627089 RepID=UPI001640E77C